VSVHALKAQGRRAGRSEEVEWLGRTGLVAQGAIYALVAVLALDVALHGRDSNAKPDKEGALQLVAEQPLGKVLLGLLAVGFAAYALWRFAQAIVDRDGKGSDAKAIGKRFGYLCLGGWYGLLTVLAVDRLLGGDGSTGSDQEKAAGVFGLPLGREIVLAAAIGFVVAAGWNVYRALGGNLDRHLRTYEMAETERKAAVTVGAAGHLARGVVFGLIGLFLGKAALDYDPQEARGLDGALLELAQRPHGGTLLAAVAIGLFAYAVWCWVQARYRDV
jgi:uncharacterized membrane protein YidH (DUF202 family)